MINVVHISTLLFSTAIFRIKPFVVLMAFLLDGMIGDPMWLPHPVRIIGTAINKSELWIRKRVRSPHGQKMGGIVLAVIIVLSSVLFTCFLLSVLQRFTAPGGTILAGCIVIYLTSTTIALKELSGSARNVVRAVQNKNLVQARFELSMIVGRDTAMLDEHQILRADMETLSENLSDGVLAPLLYLVLGGLPCAMAYKAINTLDSMVGHKNEKYLYLGWASARLDDLLNYIPARLTGLFIVFASGLVTRSVSDTVRALKTMIRDGRKHPSPNSGVPESAMAGAVGIRMGGPSSYGGIIVEKPFLGSDMQTDYKAAAEQALSIAEIASLFALVTAILYLQVRGIR